MELLAPEPEPDEEPEPEPELEAMGVLPELPVPQPLCDFIDLVFLPSGVVYELRFVDDEGDLDIEPEFPGASPAFGVGDVGEVGEVGEVGDIWPELWELEPDDEDPALPPEVPAD